MSGRKGGWIYIPVNRIMNYALLSVKPAIEPYQILTTRCEIFSFQELCNCLVNGRSRATSKMHSGP